MDVIDELVANAERYAEAFDKANLPTPPAKRLAVVCCMDSRIDLFALLGLSVGDAHLIRNAGGVITADGRRSLTISQRLLGTREIMLIHHTECGLLNTTDEKLKDELLAELGIKPDWAAETFTDLDLDVRQSIARIKADPFIPHTGQVRGFVYDVQTGRMHEVKP